MTPENFCYWLQGRNELADDPSTPPTQEQWAVIREHLSLVFDKRTALPEPEPRFTPPVPLNPDWPIRPFDTRPIC